MPVNNTPWSYLFNGFALIRRKELRPYVVIPLLINIVLFSGLIYISTHEFGRLITWAASYLPTWLAWLQWLLWILFALAMIIILAYTFTIIANLISAPFNGFLAEKVELLTTGKSLTENSNWKSFLAEIPYAIKMQIRLLLYYLPRAIGCLILFFIPVLQLIAPVLWFLLNAWMMSVQYLDYPAENHKVSFADFRRRLLAHRIHTLGFGSTVMIASMIPIINLFIMPAAVAGATLFWLEQETPANPQKQLR